MSLPVFITWAGSSANYPAGANPWNSTPEEVIPGFIAFTPGVSLPAQVLNYVVGALSREGQVICSTAINTWGPATATASIVSGATFIHALAWDDKNKLWVAAAHTADGYAISVDDGVVWLTIGALPGNPVTAIPLPNGAGVSFIMAGTTDIQFGDYAGTVTGSGTHLGVTSVGAGMGISHAASGLAHGLLWDVTNLRFRAYDTANGTAITDNSSSLPTVWHNGPINPGYFTSCLGPGNTFLFAAGGQTPGTDQSYLLLVTMSAGPTFTFADVTLPVAISGKSVTGVAYNFSSGLWGVMAWDGAASSFYTSPDLITFTLSRTFSNAAAGIATVGPYWITALPTILNGHTYDRAYSSLDGVTFAPLGSPFNGIFISGVQMAGGSGNVGMFSTAGVAVSRRVG
jgi:hypothetical protein